MLSDFTGVYPLQVPITKRPMRDMSEAAENVPGTEGLQGEVLCDRIDIETVPRHGAPAVPHNVPPKRKLEGAVRVGIVARTGPGVRDRKRKPTLPPRHPVKIGGTTSGKSVREMLVHPMDNLPSRMEAGQGERAVRTINARMRASDSNGPPTEGRFLAHICNVSEPGTVLQTSVRSHNL